VRILALETSTSVATVATLDSGQLLEMRELPPERRTAQTLAPAIVSELAAVGWNPADIGLIAVTRGPGSFTGLRIAVTTAKVLAYATGAHVMALNTLDVIAAQAPAPGPTRHLHVVMDAQRQQLFMATYRTDGSRVWLPDGPTATIGRDAWLACLDHPTLVTGPGLARLVERLPRHVTLVDTPCWGPQASTVGKVAWEHFRRGRRDDLWQLVPDYCRKSAAEEKYERSS
jgi:tRNA threonylcarbamoyladenosine biosynthesis protein TsaB